MLMFIEFPFVTSSIIDDAVSTMGIFDVESLLSVRQDNNIVDD